MPQTPSDASEPSIEWRAGEPTIQIDGHAHALPGPVDQAMPWPGRPLVAVLLHASAGPQRLLVLDAAGRTIARLAAPPGFDLYYLTPNPRYGLTVVCTTDSPIGGLHDWQFAIALDRGELDRVAPSR
jgi:hypothetical protein